MCRRPSRAIGPVVIRRPRNHARFERSICANNGRSRTGKPKTPRARLPRKRHLQSGWNTKRGPVSHHHAISPPTPAASRLTHTSETHHRALSQSINCGTGESEDQRRGRVRKESGTRHVQYKDGVRRDAAQRKASRDADEFSSGVARVPGTWPPTSSEVWPPKPREPYVSGMGVCERAKRVDEYYETLETLPGRLHKCPNCKELDSIHGVSDDRDLCTSCAKDLTKFDESNGLLLDMAPVGQYPPVTKSYPPTKDGDLMVVVRESASQGGSHLKDVRELRVAISEMDAALATYEQELAAYEAVKAAADVIAHPAGAGTSQQDRVMGASADVSPPDDPSLESQTPVEPQKPVEPALIHNQKGRILWAELKRKFGDLSVAEEALISPVAACNGVLRLPNGRQLGYTGSYINFVNDTASVVAKLPRPADTTGLWAFILEGEKCRDPLFRVRRLAVKEHLEYFIGYHAYFISGIFNPQSRDDTDKYLVPPITDINNAALDALAEDEIHQGFNTTCKEAETCADECGDLVFERTQDDKGSDVQDKDPQKEQPTPVNTKAILHWLISAETEAAAGPVCIGVVAHQINETLRGLGFRASNDAHTDQIMRLLHGKSALQIRCDAISLQALAISLIEGSAEDVGSVFGYAGRNKKELMAEMRTELHGLKCAHPVHIVDSGVPDRPTPTFVQDPAEAVVEDVQAAVPDGTEANPFVMPARINGGEPLVEYRSRGYITLGWPTLFPMGVGDFTDANRRKKISWDEWVKHLQKFQDGRFARHRRFPYFILNTNEREKAARKAGLFVSQSASSQMTVGQLRALAYGDRRQIFQQVSRFTGDALRNSPEFFKERRKELFAMHEQLGDASVFATHSHADTHCPYLHRYIKQWAEKAHPQPDGCDPTGPHFRSDDHSFWMPSRDDPFLESVSSKQAYTRRCANLVRYPHVVAQYFHLKTQLFFEHMGEGVMGADAHWCRYEWQSRGSTHAHYFLWLRGAPDLSFLDDWVQQEVRAVFPSGGEMCAEDYDLLVETLNKRALKAALDPPLDGHLPVGGSAVWPDELGEDARCSRASQWWARIATRHNNAWDEAAKQPTDLGCGQPAGHDHTSLDASHPLTGALPAAIAEDRGHVLNMCNRHTSCRADYCLRIDPKTGKQFCRFHFPQEMADENSVAHFYCERVKNGIRWRLYLPGNDPWMNTVNPEQSAANRSNVDFKPLIDHFSAIEYSTKYGTKAEKGSKPFDKLVSDVCNRKITDDTSDETRVTSALASFLIHSTGARNWSAQEVAHVNNGLPTVFASHKFVHAGLTEVGKVRKDITATDKDYAPATEMSMWNKYLDREQWLQHADSQSLAQGLMARIFHASETPAEREGTAIRNASFTDFMRRYEFKSLGAGSKGKRQIVLRETPTVVLIKPSMPKHWGKVGDEHRADYCRVQLQKHMNFKSRAHFNRYLHGFGRDYIAAYEDFALRDPQAPPCCKDDFREMNFEEEGTEVYSAAMQAQADPDFMLVHVSPEYQAAKAKIAGGTCDEQFWAQRSAARYSPEQLKDAATWHKGLAASAERVEPVWIDPATLNEGQRYVRAALLEHDASVTRLDAGGRLMYGTGVGAMVNGTAGSGKTHLIHVLKQDFGKRCLVLAPTGVAADNIGGRTYHQVLPVPCHGDLHRAELLKPGKRCDLLQKDFHGVTHVIIDEHSMVGRRCLGQIDQLMKMANGGRWRNEPFGGISVILVGDHGQLPPVKDKRGYDWSGVRRTDEGHRDEYLDTAPKWEQRGVEQYDGIVTDGLVFFLDAIERCSDPFFQGLQLRARDGAWGKDDVNYMREHMGLTSERIHDFNGPEVYRLVSTRAMRDSLNAAEVEHEIDSGAAAITLQAVNSSAVVAAADEDHIKFPNEILLCLGSRLMVIKNISVEHSLVNGTTGFVHDVMCDCRGRPVAVLLVVQRRTSGSKSGYSGPSFLEHADGVNMETHAVVSIGLERLELWSGSTCHSRTQFPVVPARAVTVHKAQGLTLDRVVFDPGGQEYDAGSFFTALTRVREVSHLVFDPMPDDERVTDELAKKPQMFLRKQHERVLRCAARRTARQLAHLHPPQSALAALGPPPKPWKASTPPITCKAKRPPRAHWLDKGMKRLRQPPLQQGPQAVVQQRDGQPAGQSDSLWEASPAPLQMLSSPPAPPLRAPPPKRAEKVVQRRSNQPVLHRWMERLHSPTKPSTDRCRAVQPVLPLPTARVASEVPDTAGVLRDHGVPPLGFTGTPRRPGWLADALPALQLEARIVDYWADNTTVWSQVRHAAACTGVVHPLALPFGRLLGPASCGSCA